MECGAKPAEENLPGKKVAIRSGAGMRHIMFAQYPETG
jgi:hypothetical protein